MNNSESTAASSLCWNCHAHLDSPYQCDRCVKIQPWPDSADFFTFLGLPRRLRIDASDLEDRFLKLSRLFHPDFFQDSSDEEQDISLVNAARLNKAYSTLKDPVARAEYILDLELGARRKPDKTVPPSIAAEIMDLQELLAEHTAVEKDHPDRTRSGAALTGRLAAIEGDVATTVQELETLFAEYDHVMAEATSPYEPMARRRVESILARVEQTLAARLYLKRIADNITAALEGKDVNLL